MKRFSKNIVLLVLFSLGILACKKENTAIDSEFRINSISVEYPGAITKSLTGNDTITVDTSGVLTYNFTVSTLQELKQVSVFNTYWNFGISDSRFNQSYGERFASSGFDNDKSITFDVIIDLSNDANGNHNYPNHNSLTVQAFVENALDNGAAFLYTIDADSMLAK